MIGPGASCPENAAGTPTVNGPGGGFATLRTNVPGGVTGGGLAAPQVESAVATLMLTAPGANYSGSTTVPGAILTFDGPIGGLGNLPTTAPPCPPSGAPASPEPQVPAGGSSSAAAPPAGGQYLVAPDGTINLREYGTVQVMGQTIAEAKGTLEKHLSAYLDSPQVFVEVAAYQSKVYYVITQGAGMGDMVRRLPITGNETVLDAIANINGLSQVSSKRVWIARPTPTHPERGTILRVDWDAITRGASPATNYQVLPGDRVFIAEDPTLAATNRLAKNTAAWERVMGLISLAESVLRGLVEGAR